MYFPAIFIKLLILLILLFAVVGPYTQENVQFRCVSACCTLRLQLRFISRPKMKLAYASQTNARDPHQCAINL